MKEAFTFIMELFGIIAYICLWVVIIENTEEFEKPLPIIMASAHILIMFTLSIYFALV